jgi:hypothetical protein
VQRKPMLDTYSGTRRPTNGAPLRGKATGPGATPHHNIDNRQIGGHNVTVPGPVVPAVPVIVVLRSHANSPDRQTHGRLRESSTAALHALRLSDSATCATLQYARSGAAVPAARGPAAAKVGSALALWMNGTRHTESPKNAV